MPQRGRPMRLYADSRPRAGRSPPLHGHRCAGQGSGHPGEKRAEDLPPHTVTYNLRNSCGNRCSWTRSRPPTGLPTALNVQEKGNPGVSRRTHRPSPFAVAHREPVEAGGQVISDLRSCRYQPCRVNWFGSDIASYCAFPDPWSMSWRVLTSCSCSVADSCRARS